PLAALALLSALTVPACQGPAFTSADAEAIRALMRQQAEAWSAGDLDGFMAPYADTICFHSPQGLTCGKQQVHDHYRRSYPDFAAMGRLRFDVHELIPAGAHHAWVTGAWALRRQADSLSGAFALLWVRGPEGWRIARDHTY
ncbi:MAG: YybH family protein, partial [Flavobacteriales bacterium]